MDQRADTLPAAPHERTPSPDLAGDPADVALRQLRAKVHGRLFGSPALAVTVGRYQITEYVGSGGMGVVYAALDPELDRKVAIKVLRSDSLGNRARERLRREAKALARLSHPNVVHVYEVGGADQMYVAMEFVEGKTLRQWLDEGEHAWPQILALFVDAGRGLAAAHDAELIHRDFKPDNVLLDAEGRPKVVDFGLVLAKEDPGEAPIGITRPDAETSLTATGTLMGTPAYMAPEQHRGRKADARTDIFAFCVALFEALTGTRPFPGETYAALAESVTAGQRLPFPPSARALPKHVRDAIIRGLAVDPDARQQSIRDLLDALSRPAASRSRWIALSAASIAFAGLGAAFAMLTPPSDAQPGAVCEGAAAKLSGVWDDDTQARVRDAFTATGQPFAGDSFAQVTRELDAWEAAWTGVWGEACEGALGSDPDQAEVGLRRMRCLDLRVTELRQLSDLFMSADATVVARAVDAASGLTSPQSCVSAPLMLADGPESDAVVDVQRQLARATSLAAAGLRDRAIAMATQVEEDARVLEQPGLAARAGLLVARSQPASSPTLGRIQRLHGVVALARQAADPLTEVDAWIEMIVAITGDDDQAAAFVGLAPSWGDLAAGILEDTPDPRREVQLQLALAQLHRSCEDDDSARKRLARAKVIYVAEDGAPSQLPPDVVEQIGHLEADVGLPGDRAESLRRATSRHTQRLGRSHPATIDTMIQLAGVTSDKAEAITLLSGAFASGVAARHVDRGGLQRATKAMAGLHQLEARLCPGDDAAAGCSDEGALRDSIEKELRATGSLAAKDVVRIAAEATSAVRSKQRRTGDDMPAPPLPPTVDLEPGVAITFANGLFEVVVSEPVPPAPPPAPR